MLEYSTLNPDTNSDSPSVKSKGALLDSATKEINKKKPDNRSGYIKIPNNF